MEKFLVTPPKGNNGPFGGNVMAISVYLSSVRFPETRKRRAISTSIHSISKLDYSLSEDLKFI